MKQAQCTAKSGQHVSENARRRCPVHGEPRKVRAVPLTPPAMAASPVSTLPLRTNATAQWPMDGFHNVGFQVEYMGTNTLGVPSRIWAGTEFEDCAFPYGILTTGEGVRLSLQNCVVESDAKLGRKSVIRDSAVYGSLVTGSESTIENVIVEGSIHLGSDCTLINSYPGTDNSITSTSGIKSITSTGIGLRISLDRAPRTAIDLVTIGRNTTIHLENGGVIVSRDGGIDPTARISGDADRIAIVRGNGSREWMLGDARYKASIAREKSDPLWISAQNTDIWNYFIEVGAVDPLVPTLEGISDEDIMVGLLIHSNP